MHVGALRALGHVAYCAAGNCLNSAVARPRLAALRVSMFSAIVMLLVLSGPTETEPTAAARAEDARTSVSSNPFQRPPADWLSTAKPQPNAKQIPRTFWTVLVGVALMLCYSATVALAVAAVLILSSVHGVERANSTAVARLAAETSCRKTSARRNCASVAVASPPCPFHPVSLLIQARCDGL